MRKKLTQTNIRYLKFLLYTNCYAGHSDTFVCEAAHYSQVFMEFNNLTRQINDMSAIHRIGFFILRCFVPVVKRRKLICL